VKPFGDLILALAESLPRGAGAPELGVEVQVTGVDLVVPLESRIGGGGELRASLPRGRMATGFRAPHGRLAARFAALAKEGA
jgi:hypothetical protein